MSVLSRSVSRFRRFFSPSMAVPRLRLFFLVSTAALGGTLVLTHRLVVREHREARLLAVASHACRISARLPVVFVRPAVVKVPPKIRRTSAAAHKE